MVRAVLFDYDDTLVQTKEAKFLALRALGQRFYGKELTDADIWPHWGVAYERLFQALFGDVEMSIARAITRYESLDAEFPITPYPDALNVLKTLQASVPVGIVTSAGRSVVVPQLRRMGFDLEALALVQTAEDTSVHKPDPAVFAPALATLGALGIRPAELLYVGDSLRDFDAARSAGLMFRGVRHGTTTRREFAEAGAKCIDGLAHLVDELGP